MDDLEQKIEAVLHDPAQMEKIMEMAQSLGLSANTAQDHEVQTAQSAGEKETALLRALSPFLKPHHRKKIEKAVQLAKLSKLAKLAAEQTQTDPE